MRPNVLAFVCLMTIAAFAAKRPDFAGSWELNPAKSKNLGMMMQAKMTDNHTQLTVLADMRDTLLPRRL